MLDLTIYELKERNTAQRIPVKDSMETWKGQLVPTEVGPHVIDVTYGSFVVPKSPFTINVTSSCDMSKVKVVGLDK
jgi:hypothetical protein